MTRASAAGLRAVARLAATEALRSRLVLAVGLTIAAALVALAWGTTGDGTHAGRLRAFLSWGTGWTELVLSLTAVFTATSLAQALRDGRLVQVVTGPLPRGLLPLGWWLGVAFVLLLLVAGAQALTWGLARALAQASPPRAVEGVLGSRAVARPLPPDLSGVGAAVQARLAAMERAGELTDRSEAQREAIAAELEQTERERLLSVPPRRIVRWTIDGIHPDPGAKVVTLRFRYSVRNLHNTTLRGPRGRFAIIAPGVNPGELDGQWVGSRTHELHAPIEALGGSSAVQVGYINLEENDVVVVFPEEGVELLYPSGSFEGNVARAGLVLLGRLLVLAAVAVAMAALLDGKLAALVALFVLAVGSAQGFLHESLDQYTGFGAASPVLVSALQVVLLLLPDFSALDLAGMLAAGERVDGEHVVHALGVDGLLRSLGLLALSATFFMRRELGAIP